MGNRPAADAAIIGGGFGGAASGAAAGAAVGSLFGPVGTAIGAAIGWIGGTVRGGGIDVAEGLMDDGPPPASRDRTPEIQAPEIPTIADSEWETAISELKILDMVSSAMESFKSTSSSFAITHVTSPAEDAEKKLREAKLAYEKALEHGAVRMACGRIMMIGEPGVGKSTLLKAILKGLDEKSVGKGHYPLIEMNGSFSVMTKELEIKTLALMAQRVMNNTQGSLLKDLSSKVVVKKKFATSTSSSGVKKDRNYDSLQEIVKTVQSDTFIEVQRSGHTGDILNALVYVSEDPWQGFAGDILPAFITARSLFLLVFDASKYDFKTEERIYKWIAFINDSVNLKASLLTVFRTLDEKLLTGTKYRPILIVGTHGDVMKEEKRKAIGEFPDRMKLRFEEKVLYELIFAKIQIVSNGSCEDVARQAQDFIHGLKIPVPLSWELFRKAFSQATEKLMRPFLTLQEAATLAKVCNIGHSKDNSEFSGVLRFYHEHGALLHFNEVEHMKEIVISNPQWLIEQLQRLDPSKFPQDTHEPEWELLKKYGILIESMCRTKIWPQSQEFSNLNVSLDKAMLNLLESFHLAVRLVEVPNTIINLDGSKFFVPSILPAANTTEIASEVPPITGVPMKLSAAPLYFIFASKYVPLGCFVRLVVNLSKPGTGFDINFNAPIFRDQVSFFYKTNSDEVSHVILSSTQSYISIHIGRQNYCTDYKTSNFGLTCRNVLAAVDKTLSSVLKEWFNSIEATYDEKVHDEKGKDENEGSTFITHAV